MFFFFLNFADELAHSSKKENYVCVNLYSLCNHSCCPLLVIRNNAVLYSLHRSIRPRGEIHL